MSASLRSKIVASGVRYTAHRRHMHKHTPTCQKDIINRRLAALLTLTLGDCNARPRALVLDDASFGSSRTLAGVPCVAVTVPNPCASCFDRSNMPRCVRLRDSTVQSFLATHRSCFQLLYLDFCGTFSTCFDAVETGARHLAPVGILAYTVCNRGVPRQQIAFDALRSRELARNRGLELDCCVAYRDMVTVILTRSSSSTSKASKRISTKEKAREGHFRVSSLTGWRMQRCCKVQTLEFRVKWAVGGETWEPAETLVMDLDRATFVRLVHQI